MKIINTSVIILSIFVSLLLSSCVQADNEFKHDSTIISQMICKASHGSSEFLGKIYEYDKDDNLMDGEFAQKVVEGGYGLIVFQIPQTLQDDVDLTNIYVVATLSWDQSITPSLSGKHDISGDGMIITVKSGVGTTRYYRVRGEYD